MIPSKPYGPKESATPLNQPLAPGFVPGFYDGSRGPYDYYNQPEVTTEQITAEQVALRAQELERRRLELARARAQEAADRQAVQDALLLIERAGL